MQFHLAKTSTEERIEEKKKKREKFIPDRPRWIFLVNSWSPNSTLDFYIYVKKEEKNQPRWTFTRQLLTKLQGESCQNETFPAINNI